MSIAFDAEAVSSLVNTGTSVTWSHTCTGSNRILFAACIGDSTSDLVTGATYGGTAMTLVDKAQTPTGGRWCYLFVLVAPASDANNVVISASSSIVLAGVSSSYTGAAQSGQPDTETSSTSAGVTPFTQTSLSTVAANCWTVGFFNTNNTTPIAGTGTTSRVTSFSMLLGDNASAVSAGTNVDMSCTLESVPPWGGVIASVAPVAGAPPPTSGFFPFL